MFLSLQINRMWCARALRTEYCSSTTCRGLNTDARSNVSIVHDGALVVKELRTGDDVRRTHVHHYGSEVPTLQEIARAAIFRRNPPTGISMDVSDVLQDEPATFRANIRQLQTLCAVCMVDGNVIRNQVGNDQNWRSHYNHQCDAQVLFTFAKLGAYIVGLMRFIEWRTAYAYVIGTCNDEALKIQLLKRLRMTHTNADWRVHTRCRKQVREWIREVSMYIDSCEPTRYFSNTDEYCIVSAAFETFSAAYERVIHAVTLRDICEPVTCTVMYDSKCGRAMCEAKIHPVLTCVYFDRFVYHFTAYVHAHMYSIVEYWRIHNLTDVPAEHPLWEGDGTPKEAWFTLRSDNEEDLIQNAQSDLRSVLWRQQCTRFVGEPEPATATITARPFYYRK